MLDSVQSANYLWLYILPHTDPFINTAKGDQRQDGACFVVPIPYFSYRYRQLAARLDGWIDNITSPWKRPYYQAGPDKHEPSLLCLTCTWTPVLPIEYEFRVLPVVQSCYQLFRYQLFRAAAPQSA